MILFWDKSATPKVQKIFANFLTKNSDRVIYCETQPISLLS